jgi:hypothetical protein
MGMTGWIRGLFRPGAEKRAAALLSREERERARRELRAAKAEAEATRQFQPPTLPGR